MELLSLEISKFRYRVNFNLDLTEPKRPVVLVSHTHCNAGAQAGIAQARITQLRLVR
jgi:hypothetical protein